MKHMRIGELGEKIAVKHLLSLGYTLLSSNTKVAGVEIDILAQKDKTIYIVEVKTSVFNKNFNSPLDRVVAQKIERLARAADWYSREHDVIVSLLAVSVCIYTEEKRAECELIEL